MTVLMCAQKLTDASLLYRTGPKTKTSKMKKNKKQTDMLRRNGAGQETMESVRKREGKSGRGKVLNLEITLFCKSIIQCVKNCHTFAFE